MQRRLKPHQLDAVHLLVAGKSPAAVAQQLKLRRETLWRWRQLPQFEAEFALLMEQKRNELHQRVMRLAHTATETIEIAMNQVISPETVTMAINVLKIIGPIHASPLPKKRSDPSAQAE